MNHIKMCYFSLCVRQLELTLYTMKISKIAIKKKLKLDKVVCNKLQSQT